MLKTELFKMKIKIMKLGIIKLGIELKIMMIMMIFILNNSVFNIFRIV